MDDIEIVRFLKSIDSNISTLDSSNTNIENDISSINTSINNIEPDVSSIDTSTGNIEVDVDTLKDRVRIQMQDPESGDFGFASADPFTFTPRAIVNEHAKVHDGKGFSSHNVFTNITSGNTADLLIQNPSNNFAHLRRFDVVATVAPGRVLVFEGPTFSDEGTDISEFNLRRSSSNTANVNVTHSPTITSTGTELDQDILSGDKNVGGGSSKTVQEWILKPDTDYLLRYLNESSSAAEFVSIVIFWYR